MGKLLIIIGAAIAFIAYSWWGNELSSSALGEKATQFTFQCIVNGGTGDCHNLWFVGLHQTNQLATGLFYIGLLTAVFGISLPNRSLSKGNDTKLILDFGRALLIVAGVVFLFGLFQQTMLRYEASQKALQEQKAQQLKLKQQAFKRQQKQEEDIEINVPKVIAKMESTNNKIDNDLNKFPSIEQKYQNITAKVRAHYDTASGYYPHNSYAVGQIEYAMNQGRYATDQIHFQVMSLENSFNSSVGSLIHNISSYKNSCKSFNSVNPDVIDFCKKLDDSVPLFRTKVQAMTDGINNLEQTYKIEYKKQGDLVMALQHYQ